MEWEFESEDNENFDSGEESLYSTSSSEEEHGVHKPMPYEFDHNQTLIEDEHLPKVTQHLSPRYFSFHKQAYDLIIYALQQHKTLSLPTLQACDPNGVLNMKKWARMKESLCLRVVENGSFALCLKSNPTLRIACIEEWEDIVKGVHYQESSQGHLNFLTTLEQ
ncbi:hypothetical protein L7F22_018222 [Adiantum nelumboides]|nr:hypothetical protein [Adiantum nelumboides]